MSKAATGQPTAIALLKTGRVPSVERVQAICAALGLEFYIGPPRDEAASNPAVQQPLLTAKDILSIPPDKLQAVKDVVDRRNAAIWDEVEVKLGSRLAEVLRNELDARLPAIADAPDDMPSARPVDILELAAAAGGGAADFDETVTGRLWFRRDWLERRALDPTQCCVIGVMGESMEPTLPDGCSILIDRSSRRPRDKRIYAIRASEGLVVKRANKAVGGRLLMTSDNPTWISAPWPADAEIVGEVRWMARTL